MGRKDIFFCPENSFLKAGMTLSEIVVVVAILGLFVLLAAFSLKPSYQLAKARDSRRIADLKKISTAIEDYSGDHPCVPPQIYVDQDTCLPHQGFAPYLNPIPCDPLTKKPYYYERLGPNCKQYAIYATLELEKEISYGEEKGNYVSSNVRVEPTLISGEVTPTNGEMNPTSIPTSIPTIPPSTPTESTQLYGCFSGVCLPITPGQCQPNYSESNCFDVCSDPKNECKPPVD